MMATQKSVINGANVLITGASAGIGQEFARQLAPRVSQLVLLARRADRLHALRDELESAYPKLHVTCMSVDLSDEAARGVAIKKLVSGPKPIDILINNAGVGSQGLFDESDWSRLRQVLLTNIVALTQLTAALIPGMVVRKRGGVLNVGSGSGLATLPASAVYCASKSYVHGFSRALRVDMSGTGVVITEVCPGPVESEFDTHAGSAGGMTGGPPQFMRISASQCASEALSGFERSKAIVFPGQPYRLLMKTLPLVSKFQMLQAVRQATHLRSS